MDTPQLSRALECVLFIATEPVPMKTLGEVLQANEEQLRSALDALEERLQASGLQLVQVAGGYQLCTRPEFAEVVARYLQPSPVNSPAPRWRQLPLSPTASPSPCPKSRRFVGYNRMV